MKLTPQAKKIWQAVSPDQRLRILNHVWCTHCMKISSIGNASGKVEKGCLALTGVCTHCGGLVAKMIEPE